MGLPANPTSPVAVTLVDASGNVQSPSQAFQHGVPFGAPSSGSVAANGALTGLTAFPITYSDIFLWFPAGAVFAGSAAGAYYCQMSSTTAGTIFNNVLSGFPTIPASPTPVVAAGPGAYTQTTGSNLLLTSVTIPANSLQPNGSLTFLGFISTSNSVNNKILQVIFVTPTVVVWQDTFTTTATAQWLRIMFNRGKTGSQAVWSPSNANSFGADGTTIATNAMDTTAVQNAAFRAQLAVATDFALYEATQIIVTPSP